MSKTVALAPIISALMKAENFLGPDRNWAGHSLDQCTFLNYFFSLRNLRDTFSKEELRSWASRNCEELNAVLKKEGFDIELSNFGPKGFGLVSILDVREKWLVGGRKTLPIFRNNKSYPAARLDSVVNGITIIETFYSPRHLRSSYQPEPEPIFQIETQSGDRVYMTMPGSELEGFDLLDKILQIYLTSLCPSRELATYDYLIFPMINLDQQIGISWLRNMDTIDQTGQEYYVSRALQQTKLKINHQGARVKSAAATGIRCTSVAPPPVGYVLDEPFFFWIRRPGLSIPIVAAYLDEDSWKDPDDLKR